MLLNGLYVFGWPEIRLDACATLCSLDEMIHIWPANASRAIFRCSAVDFALSAVNLFDFSGSAY